MTGREHLQFYAQIRGVRPDRREEVIDCLISKLDLEAYQYKAAGSYSGGNKRKLSVAIALVGNPTMVFLDEPSTGMDPVARRQMWEVINSTMAGRSVILTTHSMEECEALCPRIGIMVDGKMKCLGSSQRLKSRFGTGFTVDMNCAEHAVANIKEFMSSTYAQSRVMEAQGGHVRFQIPSDNAQSLGQLFSTLEAARADLSIDNYSVGQTSLEQVFLSLAATQKGAKVLADGTVVNVEPVEPVEWAVPGCSLSPDSGINGKACCCPCLLVGDNMALIGRGSAAWHAVMCCLLPCVFAVVAIVAILSFKGKDSDGTLEVRVLSGIAFFGFVFLSRCYGVYVRTVIRSKLAIAGSCLGDCFQWFCCCCCALAQETTTIRTNEALCAAQQTSTASTSQEPPAYTPLRA